MNAKRLVLILTALLAPGLSQALPAFDQHVVFANSRADGALYDSEGSVIGPSRLELSGGKAPIDTNHWISPPNSLRLAWRSARGGDWSLTVKAPDRYGRRPQYSGDSIAFWCLAPDGLKPEAAPLVTLQDGAGEGVPAISMLPPGRGLAPKQWTLVRLPLSAFTNLFGPTEPSRFNLSRLSAVKWMQRLDDDENHILCVDNVFVVGPDDEPTRKLAPPTGLAVRPFERHCELAWDPAAGPAPFAWKIRRSIRGGPWTEVGLQRGGWSRYEDFTGAPGVQAAYTVSAADALNRESAPSAPAGAVTRAMSDDDLLSMVEEASFRYYWDGAHPDAGMALEIQPGDENLVAVGASGFGLMAIVAGAERGFIPRDQAVGRLRKIVRFLGRADRFHGVWPHFLDGRTGRRIAYFGPLDDGGDLVETSFLAQGLLTVRQYLREPSPDERRLRADIDALWRGIEWDWHRKSPESPRLYWHWSPNHGFAISHPLVGWNETMITYLLAVASPTHPAPARLFHTGWAGQDELSVRYRQGWARTTEGDHYTNGRSYFGIPLEVGVGVGGELFFTQFSFLGFDPRGKRDRYANYFENNRRLARIQHAYCRENPRHWRGYGPDCWGLSAGIHAGGGKAQPRDDNGTITCSASLACFPYTPGESMDALRHFYRDLGSKVWGVYGFYDGFNESENWFDEVYMGLNQAPTAVMIENARSGLLWRLFMSSPEIQPALEQIGFRPDAAP